MPPKKAKGAGSEEKAVLEYLVKANRPYSANDISSQLHGLVSPAQAKKVLNDLADDGKIQRKANGKQQIFYATQTDIDVPSVEEAEAEEEAIAALEQQVGQLKEENKVLGGRLQALTTALTDEQMRERIAQLGRETEENEGRLAQLRSGEVISPEEKARIEAEHGEMVKHWRARKRMFKNIADMVAEGYPGKMSALFEELGIETDEDVQADVSILGQ
ncbi:PSMC3 interacting protein [Coemansia javaensis]|uniref:Homologous-pairing protein 2 homolog n=1 Tax=Coemansia javaensis TaxID=2761396 RepID=A0A9W8LE95_9FUNG|nr:PSMC3 interacting protein [Coemansia javaensis]